MGGGDLQHSYMYSLRAFIVLFAGPAFPKGPTIWGGGGGGNRLPAKLVANTSCGISKGTGLYVINVTDIFHTIMGSNFNFPCRYRLRGYSYHHHTWTWCVICSSECFNP